MSISRGIAPFAANGYSSAAAMVAVVVETTAAIC
jgi:hypothetical protein